MSALKRSLRIDLSRVQINTNKAVILHYLSTFQKILDFSRVFCYCRLSDNSNLGAEQSTPRNGGEGGTRTLAPVTRPTPLAGAPRHQLEYFSIWSPVAVGNRISYSVNGSYQPADELLRAAFQQINRRNLNHGIAPGRLLFHRAGGSHQNLSS